MSQTTTESGRGPEVAATRNAVNTERVLVLDFGSQYAQLIARRVREQHVYCEIVRHDITAERVAEIAPKGIILSGGPASIYEDDAPRCDPGLLSLGIPVLGICYGMQAACEALGGKVGRAEAREYGRAGCNVLTTESIMIGIGGIEVFLQAFVLLGEAGIVFVGLFQCTLVGPDQATIVR